MQLELNLETNKNNRVNNTEYGLPFKVISKYPQRNDIFIRVSPTRVCFNSHFISDVTSRGDCFVVNLITGVFHPISGDLGVEIQNIVLTDKGKAGAEK